MMLTMLLAVLIALTGCTPKGTTLKIGIIKPSIDHVPLSYAIKKGAIDAKAYQTIPFTSGWELQEALIAGRVDIGIMPFTYVWNAVSKGYPVKTVSFFERETDAILAKKEITGVKQLYGKKIGLLKGSTLDILWQEFATRNEIIAQSVFFRSPNEIVSALRSNEIDAAVLYVPVVEKLESDYPVLHWFGTDYPAHPCCDIAVNTEVLSARKLKQLRLLFGELETACKGVNSLNDDVSTYLEYSYALDKDKVISSMQHTKFQMGLQQSGKDFQRYLATISLNAGYLDKLPDDKEVYLDINPGK